MSSEKRVGHFVISERRVATRSVVCKGIVLLLAVASWERRCLEVMQTRITSARIGVLICFKKNGGEGQRKANFDMLLTWMHEICENVIVLDFGSSIDYVEVFPRMETTMIRNFIEAGGAMNVLFDVSCCPKTYILFLLGLFWRRAIVRRLDIFYAEAEYEPIKSQIFRKGPKANTYNFTEGEWESVQIPYLEGTLMPGRRRLCVVSLGFESDNAKKFLKKYEAERYLIVIPNPGFSNEYTGRSAREAENLRASYDLDDSSLCPVGIGEVGRVAEVVQERVARGGDQKEIMLFCLGPKTHAIGFAMAGILLEQIAVVCRVPGKYVEGGANPTGISWFYRIEDTSVPRR